MGDGLRIGNLVLIFVVIGIVMALVTFFPWLTPTPPDMRPSDPSMIEKSGDVSLPGGALRSRVRTPRDICRGGTVCAEWSKGDS